MVTLNFAGMDLPITALALEKLDCDILADIPFCKISVVVVHLKDENITTKDLGFPYGVKDVGGQHDIKILKNLYKELNRLLSTMTLPRLLCLVSL